MAQIDPSIAMGFRPIQIESPVNQMAAISQLQNAQQQQQMNALKMQEYERGLQSRNKLARIYADPTLKPGSPEQLLRIQQEVPDEYEGAATRALQRENILSQKEQREAEAEKRQFESKKLQSQLSKEQLNASLSELASYTSVDEARSALEQKVSAGALTREQADRLQQGLPADDAGMPAWQIRTMRGLLTPSEVLQDVRAEKKDAREEERLKLEDARVQETQRHALEMEKISRAGADRAQLQLEETTRHNKAMERLRAREINKPAAVAAPTVTMVVDPNNPTQMLLIDAKLYKGGSLNSPGVIGIAGKEPVGAKKAEAKETAQENAGNTIALLRQNFDQLDKLGGITSTQNRPGTNIGAYLSTTGAGQLTGRMFGTEAQSERNKIAQTRPLLMTQIMSALGLSAKQLDSNAELKLWLSAATDPTLDLESNKAALDNLENLLAGKGKAKPAAPSAKPAPPPPANFVIDKK
jgi:hypothetical protein